jgi:hypothetical protein
VYDELAAKTWENDTDEDGSRRMAAIYDRLNNIAEAASYLSPRSAAGAAFQIMLADAEIDLTIGSENKPYQLKAAKAKLHRLLYRALDVMPADTDGIRRAREYLMSEELDPARAGLREDEEDRTDA